MKEVIEVTEEAGVPFKYQPFQGNRVKNWGKEIYKAIELIDAARAAGQDVTVDFIPTAAAPPH